MDVTLRKCSDSPHVPAQLGEILLSGVQDTTEMCTAPKLHLEWYQYQVAKVLSSPSHGGGHRTQSEEIWASISHVVI